MQLFQVHKRLARAPFGPKATAHGLVILATAFCMVDSVASEFCDTLTEVAQEAGTKFRSLRAGRDELGDYRSKITLPGAEECTIDRTEGDFGCTWRVRFDQDASEQLKSFAFAIRDCYPHGKFQENYPSKGGYAHFVNEVKFFARVSKFKSGERVMFRIERSD